MFTNQKTSFKKMLSMLLVITMVTALLIQSLTLTQSVQAAVDPLQKFLLSAMSSPNRNGLNTNVLQKIEKPDDVTDSMVNTAKTYLPDMSDSEIRQVLLIYAESSSESRADVRNLVIVGLTDYGGADKFPGIAAAYNSSFAGSATDFRGTNLVHTVLVTAYFYTFLSGGPTPLAYDGTPETDIDFKLQGDYTEVKVKVSKVMQWLPSLRASISSCPGQTDCDKMLNYLEQIVNSNKNEILEYKKFLNTLGIYQGTLPGSNGNLPGGGGTGGDDSATASPTPVTSPKSTPSPTPSPTPTPTPTPVPRNVAEAVGRAMQNLSEIENAKDPEKAMDKAKELINLITLYAGKTGTEGIVAAETVDALATIADIAVNKVNAAAADVKKSGEESHAVIDKEAVGKLGEQMDSILQAVKELNAELKETGFEVKAEAVLQINAASEGNIGKADTQLPAALLQKASEKKMDGIAVHMGLAEIKLPPAAVPVTGNENVVLSVQKDNVDALVAQLQKDPANEALCKSLVGLKDKNGELPVYDFNLAVGDKKVSNFAQPVEISLPYTLKKGEDPEKLTVYYISDKGILENVIGRYDARTGSVKFSINHFSRFAVKSNQISFSDLKGYEWARKFIETMVAKGVLEGTSKVKFSPQAYMTRAEFTAALVKELKLQDVNASCSFKDVPKDSKFYLEIASAVKAGLIADSKNSFDPNKNITRQDMLVIAGKAIEKFKEKTLPANPDLYLKKYLDRNKFVKDMKPYLAMSVKYGLAQNLATNSLFPEKNVNRAEAAMILYKLFYIE